MGPDGTLNTSTSTFIPYNSSTVITGNPNNWFNALMFTPGPLGYLGTAGRDVLRGPHMSEFDLSINKDTPLHILGEAGQIQFRAEFFNLFNHANFGMPNGEAYAGTLTDVGQYSENPVTTGGLPSAGKISNTVTTSRQIQLSLKIVF
jgi:hypothetical protein